VGASQLKIKIKVATKSILGCVRGMAMNLGVGFTQRKGQVSGIKVGEKIRLGLVVHHGGWWNS